MKLEIFKLKLARFSNSINKKLFKQIFGHTLIKLANKIINTKNKEEYQIIVKNIKENIDKLFEMDNEWVDLCDAANLILDFRETIQLDLV